MEINDHRELVLDRCRCRLVQTRISRGSVTVRNGSEQRAFPIAEIVLTTTRDLIGDQGHWRITERSALRGTLRSRNTTDGYNQREREQRYRKWRIPDSPRIH